jgi:L-lactate dehydrogenase complex protein LldG
MSDARSAIFGAIDAALGRQGGGDAQGADAGLVAAEAQALLSEAPRGQPSLGKGTPLEVFEARLLAPKVGASVRRVEGLPAVPSAVAAICAAEGLGTTLALQPAPELRHLDWSGFETKPTVDPDEAVAVGIALWGVAETGTLVFHSGPDSPTLFAFLPMHHIVVIPEQRILAHLEDYAARTGPSLPRNVNLVTGASGTTDIEGTLVKGAHGPAHLHVVVVLGTA